MNFLASGNSKLGTKVHSFSLPPGGTCPGKTSACSAICYAQKSFRMYPSVKKVYRRNASLTPDQIESQSLKPGGVVRIHVSGNFQTPEYIHAWRRLAKSNPSVRFYAYTRSWRVAGLLPSLEALRALPNVVLFASIDEETGLAPKGWRFAMMGKLGDHNAPGSIQCPEQTGKVSTCSACGLCFNPSAKVNLTFATH